MNTLIDFVKPQLPNVLNDRNVEPDATLSRISKIIADYQNEVARIQEQGDVVFGSVVPNRNGKGYMGFRFFADGKSRYVSKRAYRELVAATERGRRVREAQRRVIGELEQTIQSLKESICR